MKVQKSKEKFETRTMKGQLQLEEYNLKDARKNHKQALKAAEEMKDELGVASSYHCIATTYYRQGKLNEALKHLNKSLDIHLDKLGKDHPNVAAYNNIAVIYEEQGKYEKAFEYYNKAFKIFKKRLGTSHSYTTNTLQYMVRVKKYLARTKSL